MAFVATILLAIYYAWDKYLYNKETNTPPQDDGSEPLGLEGSFNLLLILGVVGAVLFSGLVKIGEFTVYHVHVRIENVIRDVVLLFLTWVSWHFTSKKVGLPMALIGSLFKKWVSFLREYSSPLLRLLQC